MSNSSSRFSAIPWPLCGTLGAALLLAAAFALAWYHFAGNVVSFNADMCYCLHFCDDILHGRDLRGWHLPAAPYLVPDMVVVGALTLLTTNVCTVFLIYSILYYVSLLAVLVALFHRMGIPRREAFTIAVLDLALMLVSCFPHDYVVRSVLFFYPGNHMACLLVGLAATALVLRNVTRGYSRLSAVLFALLCGLCAFSDHLLIVQFLAPIGAATLLLALCRLFPWRRALLTTALLASAVLLAMTRESVLSWFGLVPLRLKPALRVPGIDALRESAQSFWIAFHNQWLMLLVCAVHLAGALTAALFWLRRCLRARASAEIPETAAPETRPNGTAILFVSLVLLLAPLSNAAALIVNDMVNYSTLGEDRYLYTWLLLPFLFIALWPRLLAWRPAASAALLGVIAVVLVRLLTFPDALTLDGFGSRYPPVAQALDDMVRKHGRLRGFAEYWHAREMHYLTHERVDVLPILPSGQPRFHGFNPNCFLSEDRRDLTIPDYHFFLMPTNGELGPDPEQILLRYGKPAEIISVDKFDIWRYDRLDSRQLDLFLRAQMAQRLVEQKPFVGPSEPRILAQPKRNLTPWGARGNVQIPHGGTLVLRFDKPVRGAMIDLAANFTDQYVLRFFRAGRELDKAHVSTVDWNGAESGYYCDPGLQARLVAVPGACRDGGFDEVRVTPFGPSPHFAIGHFLVFDEWVPCRSGWGRRDENYRRYEGEKMIGTASAEVTTIADASASAGQARQATAAFQGFMAYGPYLPLPPGRYRLDFAVKSDNNTSTEPVAILDACAYGGQERLQVRPVRGSDFSSPNRYQVFSFTFEAAEELDLVEYRVMVTGKAAVTLDYVEVTRLTPERSAEACEPQVDKADR
jgi:hypothetical protein